jgi:type IX secretion system PorP/SprF family membrane protein
LGNTSGQNSVDANAGIVFYSDKLCAGFSTTQLFRNAARFNQINTESYYERHYFLTARYRMDVKKIGIEPNAVLKMVKNSPVSLDAGVRISYNRSAWLGVQYRTSNAITLQLGANIVKNFYLSYGYEIGTGKLRTASNGTHEIQLGFYLGAKRKADPEAEKEEEEKEPEH